MMRIRIVRVTFAIGLPLLASLPLIGAEPARRTAIRPQLRFALAETQLTPTTEAPATPATETPAVPPAGPPTPAAGAPAAPPRTAPAMPVPPRRLKMLRPPGTDAPPAPPMTPGSPAMPHGALEQPAPTKSAFEVPKGLSIPAEQLYEELGYIPGWCVPLTPLSTFDIAHGCYVRGEFEDAVIFAAHGLTMCDDARLHLIKGVCELHLAKCKEAEATATKYRKAIAAQQTFGLDNSLERVNDPMRVRFDQVVQYQNTGR